MKMTCKLWIAPLLLLPLAAAIAHPQDAKPAEAAAKTDDPMMAKMTEFATPGPAHRVLVPKVGKWNLKVKIIMVPGTPAQESTATAEVVWMMDGRYLQDDTKGDFMGQPFLGRGTTGYDNLKKKYVATWFDNFGTGISYGEGTYDAAKKTFTYTSQSPDVMAGKYVPAHSTEVWTSNDAWVMQSFTPGPDGKDYMSMEIHYTRAK